MTCLNIYIAMT